MGTDETRRWTHGTVLAVFQIQSSVVACEIRHVSDVGSDNHSSAHRDSLSIPDMRLKLPMANFSEHGQLSPSVPALDSVELVPTVLINLNHVDRSIRSRRAVADGPELVGGGTESACFLSFSTDRPTERLPTFIQT